MFKLFYLMRNISFITAVIATTLLSTSAAAQVYKWRDHKGQVQYSENPTINAAEAVTPNELINSLQNKNICTEPLATKSSTSTLSNLKIALHSPKSFFISSVIPTANATTNPEPNLPIIQAESMPAVDLSKQPEATIGSSTLNIKKTTQPFALSKTGAFRIWCKFSHMNNDDPIVYPGKKNATHHHTYFGNTSVDFETDPDTLPSTGNSTCHGGIANRSAYWVPSMIDTETNTPLLPDHALFYYKTNHPEKVIAPPIGLRMVARDATSTYEQKHVRFTCNEDYLTRKKHVPTCTSGGTLEYFVAFPSCWDGVNLDSPDHKSHMAYTSRLTGGCPASHPKVIPNITFNIYYKVTTKDTSKWRLASDNYVGKNAGYSIHGDWINGWDEDVLNTFIVNCLQSSRDCHGNLLGDGTVLF